MFLYGYVFGILCGCVCALISCETMDAEKEVLRQLSELCVEHLKLVHTELGLTEISDDNKKESDSYIRKMIIRHLSSDEVVEVEDEGLSTYGWVEIRNNCVLYRQGISGNIR